MSALPGLPAYDRPNTRRMRPLPRRASEPGRCPGWPLTGLSTTGKGELGSPPPRSGVPHERPAKFRGCGRTGGGARLVVRASPGAVLRRRPPGKNIRGPPWRKRKGMAMTTPSAGPLFRITRGAGKWPFSSPAPVPGTGTRRSTLPAILESTTGGRTTGPLRPWAPAPAEAPVVA